MSGPLMKLSQHALEENLRVLRRRVGGRALFPVIKADAYGHSAVLVAQVCESFCSEEEIPYLLVARVEEARVLRNAGIQRSLLVLSSFSGEDFANWPDKTEVVLTSARDVKTCLERPRGSRLEAVHLNINTGMNRLGIRSSGPFEPSSLIEMLSQAHQQLRNSGLMVRGLMSHLARSEEDPSLASNKQIKFFNEVIRGWRARWNDGESGPFPHWIHLANSEATARNLAPDCNGVRPGLHLYGLFQSPAEQRELGLRPVARVEAPLRQIFWAESGEGLGYGHRFVCRRRTLVGTLPLGYADGIRRALSRAAHEPSTAGFVIEGVLVPIAGTVSMDLTMVDLTDHPLATQWSAELDAGREPSLVATWIGPGQSAEQLAQAMGTISYEVVCALGHRIPRVLQQERLGEQ